MDTACIKFYSHQMKNLENTRKFNLCPFTVPVFQKLKSAIQLLSCQYHENQTNVKTLVIQTNAQFYNQIFYYLAPTCNGTVPIHAKQNTPHRDGIQFGSRNEIFLNKK